MIVSVLEICDGFSVSKGTGFLHPPHWTDFQALGWGEGEVGGGETKRLAHKEPAPTSATNPEGRKEGRKEGWMDGWMISGKETIFC